MRPESREVLARLGGEIKLLYTLNGRMFGNIQPVQPGEPAIQGGWRHMARRRSYQKPEPREVNGQWKIWYRAPIEQDDGSIKRVQRVKCLGLIGDMTLTAARKARDQFLQPINDVEQGIEHARKTMHHLIARWRFAVKPTLKLSTQLSYEWAIKRIGPAFGASALASIGKADVQTFLTVLVTRPTEVTREPLSPESLRDLRARLRGLLSIAEEWGWIKRGSNPAGGRLRLPERVAKRPKQVLWPAEFQKLLAGLSQPYRAIVMLAVLGGLRRGELAALRWNDNRKAGQIRVDEACYWGMKDSTNGLHSWRLGSPKTASSRRDVSIGPAAQAALNEWRANTKFTGSDDFMFAIRTNTPIDLHTAVARHLEPAAKAAGVPGVSWHDLRHTYATWGRLAGMEPEVMRDQLGHSSVLMTLDVYSHIAAPAGEKAGETIERYAMATNRVM
jgi:integrase